MTGVRGINRLQSENGRQSWFVELLERIIGRELPKTSSCPGFPNARPFAGPRIGPPSAAVPNANTPQNAPSIPLRPHSPDRGSVLRPQQSQTQTRPKTL